MVENKNAKTPADDGKPVAWQLLGLAHFRRKIPAGSPARYWDPLYAAPPKKEWVGLTDEQVEDEWERITGHSIFGGDRSEGRAMHISPDEVIEFSRAIESKLKEKNGG